MAAITDYQWRYGDLTLGRGTDYGIRAVSGLEDLSIRSGSIPTPRRDGSIQADHFVSSRDIVMEITVAGEKDSDARADALAALYAQFNRSDDPISLSFKEPGYERRHIWARVIGRSVPRNPSSAFLRASTFRLIAEDPRIYSVDKKTGIMDVYDSATGGFDLPVIDFPVNFDPSAATTEVNINNAGDADAYPVITVFGPPTGTLTALEITNTRNGDVLDIDTTLVVDQILTIDMGAYITANGDDIISLDGSTRFGDWQTPRIPLRLAPGDNTLRFEITGTTTDAKASITMQDTWL
jgi:hypothetical protein